MTTQPNDALREALIERADLCGISIGTRDGGPYPTIEQLAQFAALSQPAEVAQGWKMVPSIGTQVKASHPITCFNPTEWFEVTEVRAESDGGFAVRGKDTCWFGIGALSASPAAPQAVTTAPCKGTNCGCTDGVFHSLECQAEHAAAIAGGEFVKAPQGEAVAGKWKVEMNCCGYAAGVMYFNTWEDADRFRESYTSGYGVHPNGYSAPEHVSDHRRAAIITAPQPAVAEGVKESGDLSGVNGLLPETGWDEWPREKSPTQGMNLGQRIQHVGGRTNAAGYIEFGSPMAVDALIKHVLRDTRATQPETQGERVCGACGKAGCVAGECGDISLSAMPKPALWFDPETGHWKKLTKPDRPTYEAYYSEGQMRAALLAAAPVVQHPDADEFTNAARDALAWVLWHHQGASSPVGGAIRFVLGMGAHDRLSDAQIAGAKRWAALLGSTTEDFKRAGAAPVVREPLSNETAWDMWCAIRDGGSPTPVLAFARAIERAHGIGGIGGDHA